MPFHLMTLSELMFILLIIKNQSNNNTKNEHDVSLRRFVDDPAKKKNPFRSNLDLINDHLHLEEQSDVVVQYSIFQVWDNFEFQQEMVEMNRNSVLEQSLIDPRQLSNSSLDWIHSLISLIPIDAIESINHWAYRSEFCSLNLHEHPPVLFLTNISIVHK